MLILETTFSNLRSQPVSFHIPVTGFPWVNRDEKSTGNYTKELLVQSSEYGQYNGPTSSTSNVPDCSKKRTKTQANLFVLPAPLSPWGTPAGDRPPAPGPATNHGKLSFESRVRKGVLQAGNGGSWGSAVKLIQSCLYPIPSAAHVTPLRGALTRSHRYYSCHGRQVAPLHYIHFRIALQPPPLEGYFRGYNRPMPQGSYTAAIFEWGH